MRTCVVCGESAEIHHILTRASHPESKDCEWNHLELCRGHHSKIHAIGRTSFVKKYGLEQEMLDRGFFFDGKSWRKHKE